MHIPRFWAQARLRHETGLRHGVTVQRWGWSDDSQPAAETHARERAQEALDHLLLAPAQRQLGKGFHRMERLNEYGLNGETPIREEVLEQRGSMVLTRNSYGAHCLNTPDIAIADIDTEPPRRAANSFFPVISLGFAVVPLCILLLQRDALSPQYLLSWIWIVAFALLFARNLRRWLRNRTQQLSPTDLQTAALERVTSFSHQHPDWGLRLYKTPKGLRIIVTHQQLTPSSSEARHLFSALQVDPLYARLCERQQCFRARVSGKPWRMGMNGPSPQVRRWPVSEPHADERQRWTQHYDQQATQYSACQFVSQLGAQQLPTAIQPLVDWHDTASRAHEPALPAA